ncbi:MAG: hypothetical protein ABJC09_03780 [Terriglobia bacterium]
MRRSLSLRVLTRVVPCIWIVTPALAQITLSPQPTRVIGQTSLTIANQNPNLVEGREFFAPQGIALDLSTNPPALYVADTGNNRVLGFRSASGFANGQKADLVLGQPNLATTLQQGPGANRNGRSSGLATPTGLIVDKAGNVYVVDSGNNRILRFPKPLSQPADQLPDFVIGQPSFNTSNANQAGISSSTLFLSFTLNGATTTFQSYIAFDASGNLWVADTGNNRVLRFNASALGSQASPGPKADIVLGQVDFISGAYIAPPNPQASLTAINAPTGIVFDSGGRLFVSESNLVQRGRILVWNSPSTSGQSASRILGVETGTPPPPFISQFQLQSASGGLFTVGNQVGIADALNNRLLLYPPADQWSSNTLNQPAIQVVGQPDFNSGSINQGQATSGAATLYRPAAAIFSGTELFVADTGNHRVVVLPQSSSGFGAATRVLGQDAMNLNTLNLLEGREFNFGSTGDAGLAVDLNSTPPHLYVSDPSNNRILGFNDLRNIQPGAKADLVIGQPDFQQSLINYPSNDSNTPNQSGLNSPKGVLVDSDGNLYVADSGNGRVIRFPAPFANYKPGLPEPADLVLGQSNFFTTITDATARTLGQPFGLAMTLFPGILVSDIAQNRVLFFPGSAKTFTNGESATVVFGQPDFTTAAAGSGLNRMNQPRHIATDSDDRLYVADSLNSRIDIFDHAPNSTNGRSAAITLTAGLSNPRGLYVSPVNGDIWVADAGSSTAIRYPAFNNLEIANYAPNTTLAEFSPRAITEDAYGNVFIADIANRVVIHYPSLSTLNAANFLFPNVLAPGEIAAVFTTGNLHEFGTTSQSAPAGVLPLPRQLNGVQVLFNGSPVPLFFAGTEQINFQVPMSAPQSGTADLQVFEVATGRVLGDSLVSMNTVAPGLFTQAGNGSGAAAATNEDGTINSQTNPAIAGKVITLYGTGQGFIDGAPPDGNVAGKALSVSRAPTVFIGAHILTGPDVLYSGLAPTLVGVWQINARIPVDTITLPDNPTIVLVQQASVSTGNLQRVVQIYVKQP